MLKRFRFEHFMYMSMEDSCQIELVLNEEGAYDITSDLHESYQLDLERSRQISRKIKDLYLDSWQDDYKPEGFTNQYLALAGLFCALDGINEKGLAMADLMAGDEVETHQRTDKPDLTTSAAIRYCLNKAANIDEALELLRGIDMHSDIGSAHHYAMADASGRSVVVEYVDNEMVVVESPIVANHYLCEATQNVGLEEGDNRYEQLCQRYEDHEGIMSEKELTEAIKAVSQPEKKGTFLGTAWTMVMNLTHPSVTYYSRRHFEKPFRFEFKR